MRRLQKTTKNLYLILICLWMQTTTAYVHIGDLAALARADAMESGEVDATAEQLVRMHGFDFEEHFVTTRDGYILQLHRIPSKHEGRSKPVFIQHGLLQDSTAFLTNTAHNNLPFVLSRSGFDVWLGNIRGNKYSQNHTKLNIEHCKYWEFSFDEMADIDLPSMIDYVIRITKRKRVAYIGHSQGTMIAFMAMKNYDFKEKIDGFYALAPVGFLNHLHSPIRYICPLIPFVKPFLDVFNHCSFLANAFEFHIIDEISAQCVKTATERRICSNLLFLIAGDDASDFDSSRLHIYLSHSPSGTSVKNMRHYCQAITSGRFQYYDYGWITNFFHYRVLPNSTITIFLSNSFGQKFLPPQIDKIFLPDETVFYYGGRDSLADTKDVHRLMDLISTTTNSTLLEAKFFRSYSHLDFIWAKDVGEVIYDDILLRLLRRND